MMSKQTNILSVEARALAMRMVLGRDIEYASRREAASIACKIGCSTHTLMEWVKKAEV